MALTITRIRPGEPTGAYDEQGNPILSPPTSTPIEVLAYAPSVSDEATETYGQEVKDGGTLYDRLPIDLLPTDLVVVRGNTYHVIGHVRPWRSPYNTIADGDEVLIARTS